jgi:hypothetical protein
MIINPRKRPEANKRAVEPLMMTISTQTTQTGMVGILGKKGMKRM